MVVSSQAKSQNPVYHVLSRRLSSEQSGTPQVLILESPGGSQSSWQCVAAMAVLCGTTPRRRKSPGPWATPGGTRAGAAPTLQEKLPAWRNWDHIQFIDQVIMSYAIYRILVAELPFIPNQLHSDSKFLNSAIKLAQ